MSKIKCLYNTKKVVITDSIIVVIFIVVPKEMSSKKYPRISVNLTGSEFFNQS